MVDYISRDVWGAIYAPGIGPRALPCLEAWLHHTSTITLPVDATPNDERQQMRRVEGVGQQRFGAGFSYNLAIFPSGRVYVGCGVRRVGTHTAKRNTRALGIVLVGNYEAQPVPGPMRAALVEVLRDAKRLGWLPEARLNGGHRDLKATACPGQHAYALIGGVNAEAAGHAPPPPPAPVPLGPVPPEHLGDSMARLIKSDDRPHVFATDGIRKWHVPTPRALAELRQTGMYGEQVHTVSRDTIDRMPDA
jgi:hypothetical protein